MDETVSDWIACIRPDGKVCGHPEAAHNWFHPLSGGLACMLCRAADGTPLYGPYVHEYNPHLYTMAGWLPMKRGG